MSQGNQSVLRFSIEESVWFQKGQEVAELISISIDPDITIQDNELYVSIQGALELTGEYRCQSDDQLTEEDFPAPKFVHQVEERGDGICEFSHRFPVDISIPYSRVQSIYDIDVEVASFDYVFPERSLMKLTAEISITGLYDEESNVKEDTPNEEEEETLQYRPYSFSTGNEIAEDEDLSAQLQTNRGEEDQSGILDNPLATFSRPSLDLENEDNEIVEVELTNSEDPVVQNDTEDEFEAVARKSPDEQESIIQTTASIVEMEKAVPIIQVNEAKEPQVPEISFAAQRNDKKVEVEVEVSNDEIKVEIEKQDSSESPSEEESSSSSQHLLKKKLFAKKKKSLTLSEFFARKEEQPDLTRLKVCIVQQGETLNQLAERYEVPVQQLMRVNHLEYNQDVYVGQVLYIPVTVA